MSGVSDAVEILAGAGPVVLTCEHASVRMPSPWAWPDADRWLVGTHWSYDLGVADLVRDLAAKTGWPAGLSRFTRLLADPNRPEDHVDLFRTHAEGRPIHLNAGLPEDEIARRLDRLWRPYHAAVDEVVAASPGAMILSIHSFTPVYEGKRRTLEVGVLFDEDEDLARAIARDLADEGIHVRLNEPWSGKEGLIYAPERHANAHDRATIELELRQDLLMDAGFVERMVGLVAEIVPRHL